MDATQLRYIVFLIDSKYKDHDGMIFSSYEEAKEFVSNRIDEFTTKAVIGMFVLNQSSRESMITMVETIGFSGDKKNINQLELFKPYARTV